MDVVDKATRSKMMAGIGSKNTKPEMVLRKLLHQKGFRYRLHVKALPGSPDMVFPKYRAIIYANGCFWHCHHCRLFKWPSTRKEFWKNKLEANRLRDKKNAKAALEIGWRVAVVWECAIKNKSDKEVSTTINQVAKWLKGKTTYCEFE